MASRKNYVITVFVIQFMILLIVGIFLCKLNSKTSILNTTQIIFIIIASMLVVLSIVYIIIVLIKRKNLGEVIIKLEANDNHTKFYRIVPSILLILAFLNPAISRSVYTLSISLIMVFIGSFCILRSRCFPIGLSEKGLMFFGEIYNAHSITKCVIHTENGQLEFLINNSVFGSNTTVLKLANAYMGSLIAFLNKKKIDFEFK